jgi:hypothetical protein
LTGFVKQTVVPGALILTDAWQAYASLPELGYRHRPRTQGTPERPAKLLPHIHRVFGNLKTWLGGTHHGVGHDHLQAYFDEFAFRFNRRRTPMAAFQTLLGLASGVHWPHDLRHVVPFGPGSAQSGRACPRNPAAHARSKPLGREPCVRRLGFL